MPPNEKRVDERRSLEVQVIGQLSELEREIADLSAQRDALQKFLTKVRRENLQLRDVTRKNSFDRILIETRILETLKAARKDVPAKRLFWEARGINPKLGNATFRSYMHRLKRKGLIVSSPNHGFWIHADHAAAATQPSSAIAKSAQQQSENSA